MLPNAAPYFKEARSKDRASACKYTGREELGDRINSCHYYCIYNCIYLHNANKAETHDQGQANPTAH